LKKYENAPHKILPKNPNCLGMSAKSTRFTANNVVSNCYARNKRTERTTIVTTADHHKWLKQTKQQVLQHRNRNSYYNITSN